MNQILSARIVILNYNGAELLPKCLPSIYVSSLKSKYPVSISILDNQSEDSSIKFVEDNWKDVHIYRSPANQVLCSYNEFAKTVSEPILIFLNNDIRVDENFIDPLVDKFLDDKQTFLVAPKVYRFNEDTVEAGASRAGIKFGIFWCSARFQGYEKTVDVPSFTYSSGFGAFSREKFLELGGYDHRYLPGIMEDVDLSYRAHEKKWKLYYEPKSAVYHIGQASFKKKYGMKKIQRLAHRNNFLFMWKNLRGISFWTSHLLFLVPRLILGLLKNNQFAQGFFDAFSLRIRSIHLF